LCRQKSVVEDNEIVYGAFSPGRRPDPEKGLWPGGYFPVLEFLPIDRSTGAMRIAFLPESGLFKFATSAESAAGGSVRLQKRNQKQLTLR